MAETCLKLDPYNGGVMGLLSNLRQYKSQTQNQQSAMEGARLQVQGLEDEVRKNPTNFPATVELARAYFQMQQTEAANQLLDRVLKAPGADSNAMLRAISACYEMRNYPKLEMGLDRLVKLTPDNPEAWYNLAALKSSLGKTTEALPHLRKALELSASRLQRDPKAHDLLAEARKEQSFTPLRALPDFQKLVPPN